MTGLLIATLQMMALTFVIGFIVAGVIRIIALVADRYHFQHEHERELLRLRRIQKLRRKVRTLVEETLAEKYPSYGLSKGVSEDSLMGYSFPKEDTRIIYLKKEDKMLRRQAEREQGRETETKKEKKR
ncbi:MAG: LapA family protein [Mediterranea sp.]|jgi:2-methylcitrate dehydratase PrpD|nr:LapA family protein [Mediterranea sp.]